MINIATIIAITNQNCFLLWSDGFIFGAIHCLGQGITVLINCSCLVKSSFGQDLSQHSAWLHHLSNQWSHYYLLLNELKLSLNWNELRYNKITFKILNGYNTSKLSKFGAYLYSHVHNNTFLSEKFPVITSLYTFRRRERIHPSGTEWRNVYTLIW
jgi:hypothetical protein